MKQILRKLLLLSIETHTTRPKSALWLEAESKGRSGQPMTDHGLTKSNVHRNFYLLSSNVLVCSNDISKTPRHAKSDADELTEAKACATFRFS